MEVTKERKVEEERLLSIEEAASCLGLSPWTIRDWVKRGRISSNKLGGRRLIPLSEVCRLIVESYQPATQSF